MKVWNEILILSYNTHFYFLNFNVCLIIINPHFYLFLQENLFSDNCEFIIQFID